jgi:hypothetical protein
MNIRPTIGSRGRLTLQIPVKGKSAFERQRIIGVRLKEHLKLLE